MDGWATEIGWGHNRAPAGYSANRNAFRESSGLRLITMDSEGVDPGAEQPGTMALSTASSGEVTYRTGRADRLQ